MHNRLPTLRQLERDPRYFPYRYGQALLAYIGGRFGDDAVVRYFLAAGMVGIRGGVRPRARRAGQAALRRLAGIGARACTRRSWPTVRAHPARR